MSGWGRSMTEIMNEDRKSPGSQDDVYANLDGIGHAQASQLLVDKARRLAGTSETDPIPADERWFLHAMADHIERLEARLRGPEPDAEDEGMEP